MTRLALSFLTGLVLACASSAGWAASEAGGKAELPRERVNIEVSSPGRVLRVPAGGDLQDALDEARPGDTIELDAGGVYRGPFVLRRKTGEPALGPGESRWITVRPGPAAQALPAQGTRVTPADLPAMARLESSRRTVMDTEDGASHYRFIGLEFRPGRGWLRPDSGTFLNSLVWLHSGKRSAELTPHHFIFERCAFIGDPQVGTRRGLVMNSGYTAVVDSHFADFKMVGEDAQALIGWMGPGPYRIENNYLEGSGENVMFGGGDPPIEGLVPADIEVRRNHFSKPLAWREGTAQYEGTRWSVKNLFELKNARRVLVDGNLFEYNWPESQNGFAILFTVRNQDGGAPWSVVEDVTFSNNVIRHVGSGVNILGHDDNYPSQRTRRLTIRNNLFEDVGGAWGSGDLFQLIDATEDVVIENNTARHSGWILMGVDRPNEQFRFTDNVVVHNRYGIVGTDMAPGTAALERYFPDAVFRGNEIVGGAGHSYPPDNHFPDAFPQPGPAVAAGVAMDELCNALASTETPTVCGPGKLIESTERSLPAGGNTILTEHLP